MITELRDTLSADASRAEQKEEAQRVLSNVIRHLEGAIGALE
jgi:hypothetical protein